VIVVRDMFHTSLRKAFFAWSTTLLQLAFGIALVWGILKPFVAEAYVMPSNSMAPSFLGPHAFATCSRCGGRLLVPQADPRASAELQGEALGICENCRRVEVSTASRSPFAHRPDRFLCDKLHTPRRWDAVVFRLPDHPELKVVKRLVGLPGETVVIKDGAVWVNDGRLEPPAELIGIKYTTKVGNGTGIWGTPENPARLGPDEYFLVGDFCIQSHDCRSWGKGIPRSEVEGVVALIYWPCDRWRIFQ
jgi:signal peptidase I